MTLCISLVLYAGYTYIGMHCDISARSLRLTLSNADRLLLQQKAGELLYPTFRLNRQGVLMNLLVVVPHPAAMYRCGKQYLHIMNVYRDGISGTLTPDAIEIQLATHYGS